MNHIVNELPKQPAAKILVDGLFVLCVNQQTRTASLGVYEYANQHDFLLRTRQRTHDSSVPPKHETVNLNDKGDYKSGDVAIYIKGRQPDVTAYYHPEVDMSVLKMDAKENSVKESHENDFRWIINIESERFHNQSLKYIDGILQRKVVISNGIFSSEPGSLGGRTITSAFKKAADMAGHNIGLRRYYVATQMAIVIPELADDEELVVEYSKDKAVKTLSFKKPTSQVYHEITLSNNCPPVNTNVHDRLSDFQDYYALIDLPPSDRLDVARLLGAGTKSSPCDIIYFESLSEPF